MLPVAKPKAYNSLWQFKADAWSSLKDAAIQLNIAGAERHSLEQAAEAATELLDVLGQIERFYAFPGTAEFGKVRQMFAAGRYDQFAAVVGEINRAFVTDSFRTGRVPDFGRQDRASDRDTHPGEKTGGNRPYFEVLVVEDMSEDQERSLREELRRARRPDDQFVFEIVVVPSFEDAVMAVRLNWALQACVICRWFMHRSRHDSSLIGQLVESARPDDLMERTPDDRAQELARALARIRPELDLYLMTESSIEDLAGRLSHHIRRIFHTREGALELHLSILEGIGARYRTPFFTALRSYSHRPTGVFHALPISRGTYRQVALDPGHDGLLRPGDLPGRDLRDLRRAGLAARADRGAARRSAARGQGVRLPADLLRHQRHLHR